MITSEQDVPAEALVFTGAPQETNLPGGGVTGDILVRVDDLPFGGHTAWQAPGPGGGPELDPLSVHKTGDADGVMTGFLTLSADPTADLHAATKRYVDELMNFDLFQGEWQVGPNVPDLRTPPVLNGARYLCVTAQVDVAENPPAGMAGLPVSTNIYDGSYIIWSDSQGEWVLIHAGSLTKAEADELYLALDAPNDTFVYGRRGTGTGSLTWTQAVNRSGDTMTGNLNLPAGTINNNSLRFGTIANNVGFHATGTNLILAINGIQEWLFSPTATIANTPLTMTNNIIQLLANPRAGLAGEQDAVNRRYVDARIGGAASNPPDDQLNYGRMGDGSGNFSWQRAINVAGDTMSGALTLRAATPVAPLEATHKQYVDTIINSPLDGFTYGRSGIVNVWTRAVPLAGGPTATMTGFLTLNANPTAALHAVTKQYADSLIAGSVYLGLWEVTANNPDIGGTAHQAGSRHLCDTVDPNVPEICPPGIEGLSGRSIAEGDFIIWDAALNQWDLIHAGGITKQEADSFYLSLGGGTVTGPIQLPNVVPIDPTEAANKAYVDSLIVADPPSDNFAYGRLNADWSRVLPLTGGVLSGALVLPGDPTADLQAATKKYVDDNSGGGVAGDFVLKSGDTMTGALNILATGDSGKQILRLQGQSPSMELFSSSGGSFEIQNKGSNVFAIEHTTGGQPLTTDRININVGASNGGMTTIAGNVAARMLTLQIDPVDNLDAATKQYVDRIISGQALLIGIIDATTGLCTYTASSGFGNGPLIPSITATRGDYVIATVGGTIPSGPANGTQMKVGDWLLSDGTDWILINVGSGQIVTTADQVGVVPTVAGANDVQIALTNINNTAIAKVNKTGDTMTGELTINLPGNKTGLTLNTPDNTAGADAPKINWTTNTPRSNKSLAEIRVKHTANFYTYSEFGSFEVHTASGGYSLQRTFWTDTWNLRVTGDVYSNGVRLTGDSNLRQNITAPVEEDVNLAFENLKPVRYKMKPSTTVNDLGETVEQLNPDPDTLNWGFLADDIEVGAADLVKEYEGQKNYDLAGVVSVLVAKVKQLEARLG